MTLQASEDRISPQLKEQFEALRGRPTFGNEPEAQANPEPDPSVDAGQATNDSPPPAADDSDLFKPEPTDTPDVAKLKQDLLKGFHRKQSRLSEERKAQQEAFESANQKAALLDLLMKAPDPKLALEQILGVQANGATQPQSAPKFQYKIPATVAERFDKETSDGIVDLLDTMLTQRGFVSRDDIVPYQQVVEKQARNEYENMWGELAKEYPTAGKYRQQAEKIAAQGGFSLKQALLLASDGAVVSDKMKHTSEQVRAKELTPSGAPASVSRGANGRINLSSKSEIVRQVAAKARELGLDRFAGGY